jgi:hypothetical protein
VESLINDAEQTAATSARWAEVMKIVPSDLPKRGWYLTGKEPCTLFPELASYIEKQDWQKVDDAVMAHLPKFKVDVVREWFRQSGIPEYTHKRFTRFLHNHDAKAFEESTHLGVPLIDEIARHLYKGKSFTNKKATDRKAKDQSKPEIAIKTTGGVDIEEFSRQFVETFGSLQADVDANRLGDEDYWNRHAIMHGMMLREMGPKDSAKTLMAIAFLIFAMRQEESVDSPAGEEK